MEFRPPDPLSGGRDFPGSPGRPVGFWVQGEVLPVGTGRVGPDSLGSFQTRSLISRRLHPETRHRAWQEEQGLDISPTLAHLPK